MENITVIIERNNDGSYTAVSHATGKSRPSSKTVQRIQEGITRFSEELRMVCLV